jgi:uncharacterized protein (DUF1697 family)
MKLQTWIVLLRGVNVGGNNKLPMKELVALLETLGLSDVKTYIQSGNVVLRSQAGPAKKLAMTIASAIEETFDFRPGVMAIRQEDFAKAAATNPFPEAEREQDGKTLHLFFLDEATEKNENAKDCNRCLDEAKAASERWGRIGPVVYLHTLEGFGKSKLATKVERCVGVPATARNWRTVRALLAMSE